MDFKIKLFIEFALSKSKLWASKENVLSREKLKTNNHFIEYIISEH